MKKLLVLFLIGIFCVSCVGAFNFDNSKSFDKDVGEYGKITIKNTFGLGKTLVDLELKENTEQCFNGYCYAIKKVNLYEDSILIEDVKFIGDQPLKYNFYVDGKKYKIGDEIEAGNYIVKLEGFMDLNTQTDWQIKTNGIWTEEWAEWVIGSDLFQTHGVMNDSSNAGLDVTGEQILMLKTGILSSVSLYPGSLRDNLTIWTDGDVFIGEYSIVNGNATVGINLTEGSSYRLYTEGGGRSWKSAGGFTYPMNNTNFNWTVGCSAFGTCLETTTIQEIYGLAFQTSSSDFTINLISPIDNFEITSSTQNFTGNFTPSSTNLTNATLYVWHTNSSLFKTNFTTITGNTTNETTLDISGFEIGKTYNWNYYGCTFNPVDGTNCSFATSNRTVSRKEFSSDTFSFRNSVNETSTQHFELNVTTLDIILSLTASLNYNGTLYPSTVSCTLPKCTITNDIDIPTVDNDFISQNKSFSWNISTTSSTQSFNSLSNSKEQNVSRITLAPCNTSNGATFINFTIYDAINPNPAVNSTFKSTWFYWLGGGDTMRNSSYENLTESTNDFKFCGNLNTTFITTADFEFDASSYALNNHYYFEKELSNNTLEQSLYLLEDGNATLTTLQVVDDLQRGLEDRLVEVILYDVGTGEEKVVAMGKTDHNGEDIVYLNWFDSLYAFEVFNENVLEIRIEPYKVGSTPQKISVIPSEVFSQDKFDNVIWSLTFNNVTNEFVLIYEDPFEEISGGCMRVVRGGASNYSTLYDQCLATTEGTLSYNIGANVTGTYLAAFYATGSFDILDTLMIMIAASETIYALIGNLDGTVMSLIITGTAAMFGLLVSGFLGIAMLIGGYILSIALGYQPISILPSFILFSAIAVFLIWKLRT